MPDKITSKNLGYDKTLPPFLARLRGQQTSNSEIADPILAARRRSAKVRSASEEAEDAPVVVDEDGNVVQVQLGDEDDQIQVDKLKESEHKDDRQEDVAEKEKVAGIGASKKRKVGKVVGGDDDDGSDAAIAKAVKATQKLAGGAPKDKQNKPAGNPSDKGSKKKAKKIKLSFGDDEV